MFAIRLPESVVDRIDELVRETGATKTEVAELLLTEALDARGSQG